MDAHIDPHFPLPTISRYQKVAERRSVTVSSRNRAAMVEKAKPLTSSTRNEAAEEADPPEAKKRTAAETPPEKKACTTGTQADKPKRQ